jgi:hypothetical protein
VLENKWVRLLAMTLRTSLVGTSHGQATGGFENVTPVRVMALSAAHVLFNERVMLRQVKLRFRLPMALEARRWILARIDDEPSSTPGGHVQAAGPMTGFAARLAPGPRIIEPDSRVGTSCKNPRNVRMALRARLVPHECGAGHFWCRAERHRCGRTGIEQQYKAPQERRQTQRKNRSEARSHETRLIRRARERLVPKLGFGTVIS